VLSRTCTSPSTSTCPLDADQREALATAVARAIDRLCTVSRIKTGIPVTETFPTEMTGSAVRCERTSSNQASARAEPPAGKARVAQLSGHPPGVGRRSMTRRSCPAGGYRCVGHYPGLLIRPRPRHQTDPAQTIEGMPARRDTAGRRRAGYGAQRARVLLASRYPSDTARLGRL
jgi:hypothetical protein